MTQKSKMDNPANPYTQLLEAYSQAWNEHDIDKIMAYMAEDCIFETGGGSECYGTRYQGCQVVRERFIDVWTEIPDVHFKNGQHFSEGSFGCSEWTLAGSRVTGEKLEVDGCDIFTFENGKIKSKRSYLKHRHGS